MWQNIYIYMIENNCHMFHCIESFIMLLNHFWLLNKILACKLGIHILITIFLSEQKRVTSVGINY